MMMTGICIIKLATHLGGAAFFYCPGHFPRWVGGGSGGSGGGGDSHIKKMEVLIVPFRGFGTSEGVQPQRVHRGAFVVPLGIEQNTNMARDIS